MCFPMCRHPGAYAPRDILELQKKWTGDTDQFWAKFMMDYKYEDESSNEETSVTFYLRPVAQ